MSILSIMLPLYLLVGLGIYFKRLRFPSADFWENVEKLTYFVLFPALIFSSLSRAELNLEFARDLLLLVALPTLLLGSLQALALIWPKPLTRVSPPTFTAMFQGAVRNNTMLGLVIIAMLMGDRGVALMVVVMTVMVIINNLLCVLVLEHFGENATGASTSGRYRKTLKNLAKNPLVLASISGLVLSAAPFSLPEALLDAVAYLGKSSLPLALLAIGAGLRFTALKTDASAIVFSSLSKLVFLPAIVFGLCFWLDLARETTLVFVLYAALPTAMTSYVLASQMGGNKQAMARIITLQMLLSAVTLPVVLGVLEKL